MFLKPGIVDYRVVAEKYAEVFRQKGGEIKLGEKVVDIRFSNNQVEVITSKATYSSKLVVNCAGLYSDKIARLTSQNVNVKLYRSAVNTIN